MKSQNYTSNPIKLERLKRSWTQEHLSDLTGISLRTIQRIEAGESVSLETLRLIADAMELDVDAIKSGGVRRDYGSPWSSGLKISTSLIIGLMLVTGLLTTPYSPWIPSLMVAILLLCLAFSVQGYSLKESKLLIHRLGWSTRYDLQQLLDQEVNPHATVGSIRLFGIGGLFCHLGLFRNDILGKYRIYSTDPSQSLVLKFKGRTIVISPDNPQEMKNAIESLLEGSKEASST